jgi:hypothetical protein
MTNLKFPKLIKFSFVNLPGEHMRSESLFYFQINPLQTKKRWTRVRKTVYYVVNVEVHPPYGSPNVNNGLIWQSASSSYVLRIIFFPKRSPRKLQLCRKEREMLDPAEIPLRLVQVRFYLSSNEQICEHFAVPDCARFLFNTRCKL